MYSEYKTIPEGTFAPPIILLCNSIEPIYVQPRLASKKYKKVGKEVRSKLLSCIQNGWSIIKVAKRFNINYSTAKSIVQSYKKKGLRGDDSHDARITEESESHQQEV